jgi:hypothetical protein
VPLVLYHFEELSYEQIAAHLRVSLSKVKTDIHRARTNLRRWLTPDWKAWNEAAEQVPEGDSTEPGLPRCLVAWPWWPEAYGRTSAS